MNLFSKPTVILGKKIKIKMETLKLAQTLSSTNRKLIFSKLAQTCPAIETKDMFLL